jgi:FSR family fosmidomycin resistance protein-like MFS transporter
MSNNEHRVFNLKILLILSAGHMITDIYQGALPTILPFLKEKLALTYTMTGAIMLAANLTSSVIQPLFGYLSDKKEKSFLLPTGCVFAGLGLSLLSIPSTYSAVILLVIVSGLGVASFHPEGYKTAHFFTGDKMAAGMSVFSVGGNLGFALGPILSLFVIGTYGFNFLPAMIVFSLVFLGMIAYTWGTVTANSSSSAVKEKALDIPIPSGAHFSLFLLIMTVIMRSWTQIGLMTYIPFYYIDYLKGDPMYAGKLVSVFLLGGVVGTIFGSLLADRWGHRKFLILSLAATSLFFPVVFMVDGLMVFISLGVFGALLISSFTVTIVMAQRLLPKNLGVASGLMVGFAIGTGGIGVTILGIVADHFGVPTALKSIMVLPVIGLMLSFPIRDSAKAPLPKMT